MTFTHDILPPDMAEYYYKEVSDIYLLTQLSPKERIPKLSAILEDILRSTIQQTAKLVSLIDMAVKRFEIPVSLANNLHYFRLIRNKAIHEKNYYPTVGDDQAAIKLLGDIIYYFSGTLAPDKIAQIFTPGSQNEFTRTELTKHNQLNIIERVRVIVTQINSVQITTDEFGQPHSYCRLHCIVEEPVDLDNITVTFWNKHSTISSQVWLYAELIIHRIKKIDNFDNFYSTLDDSLVILDPDFLVDVTTIADCYLQGNQNPNIAVLNLLSVESTPSKEMILGRVVGVLLERLIANRFIFFEAAFKEALQQQLLNFILMSQDAWHEMYSYLEQESRKHFSTLHSFLNSMQGKTLHSESSFLSEKVGVQGRIDLWAENPYPPFTNDIIDLKSGKFPNVDCWENNRAQLVGYELLFNSIFPGRSIKTSILYSQATIQTALRTVSIPFENKQQFIKLRNQIVADSHQLITDPRGLLMSIIEKPGNIPIFKEPHLNLLHQGLGQSTDIEKKYFFAWTTFIAREQRIAKVGDSGLTSSFADLWLKTDDDKEDSYPIISHLKLLNFEGSSVFFTREASIEQDSSLREGDIVVLYPVISDKRAVDGQLIKGRIETLTPREVALSLKNFDSSSFEQHPGIWAIESDFLAIQYANMQRSLFSFLNASSRKKSIVLGIDCPELSEVRNSSYLKGSRLTKHQINVLTRLLNAKDYYLLQGPPGTGKTRVMIPEITYQILQNTQENILLLGYTNRAIEEICKAIAETKTLPFLILGSGLKKSSGLEMHMLEKMDYSIEEIQKQVGSCRVFISTVASSYKYRNLIAKKGNWIVIVDEASQLLDPHLIGLLTSQAVSRFVLIGDEKQLPPVVQQETRYTRIADKDLIEMEMRDMQISLFERLLRICKKKQWNHAFGMLEEQGRMHPAILKFSNQLFYEGKLRTFGSSEQTLYYSEQYLIKDAMNRGRVLFIPSKRELHTTRSNKFEANYVCRLVESMKKQDGSEPDIGIITPYRAQSALIRQLLSSTLSERVTVDTVERYQGSERDIIIVSFAVNTPLQIRNLQSLEFDEMVDRKLNVAITRSRQFLILVGVEDLLRRGKYIGKLIDDIKLQKGYVLDPFFLENKPDDIQSEPLPLTQLQKSKSRKKAWQWLPWVR